MYIPVPWVSATTWLSQSKGVIGFRQVPTFAAPHIHVLELVAAVGSQLGGRLRSTGKKLSCIRASGAGARSGQRHGSLRQSACPDMKHA